MLPHYSPLKVAETFSVLSGLFPRRIDLALGRAPGTDPVTTFALQRDRRQAAPDDFPQQLAELLGYLDDNLPSDHPFARLAGLLPGRPETPEPWLLGSSPQSAIWAGQLGLPYAFADFINPEGAEIAALYRERFTPSPTLAEPRVAVGIWAIAADEDDEAERLAASSRMAMTLLRRNRLIPVPPVEKALRFLAQDHGAPFRRRAVLGTPATVRAGIEEVVASYGAEEAIVVTITYEHAARRRSYELIAEAFGLGGAAEGPAAEDPAAEGPASKGAAAEEPASKGPAAEDPASKGAAAEGPAEDPKAAAAEEPVVEGSTAAGR
jgi:luciferase family oxidoreductase group 1